ncbi:MAG: hypothetical protein IKL65_05700 [Bacilli bacterium]|nr:hypothetical protein [Bacilli bacterium]
MDLKEIGKKQFIDKGTTGRCYLLEDGNVVKIFNNPRGLYEIDRFEHFLYYENDSFMFPHDFIFDSKKFYGYITKYASGETLDRVFSKSNLLQLSTHSLKLEKNIDFVSSGGITLYDFHPRNLMYDGKKYSAIDHDEYGVGTDIEEIKRRNQSYHRILIGKLFLEKLDKFDYQHTKLITDKVREYMYSPIKPSEMIIKLKERIDREYKEDIKTLDDMDKIVRR